MTPQQLKAMKLALEVMRDQGDVSVDEWIATEKAIKEALADHAMRETQRLGQEIEQEPVGVVHHKLTSTLGADYEQVAVFVRPIEPGTKLYTHPPQPEQEPVAWVSEAVCDGQYIDGRPRKIWWECKKGVGTAFYTTPPKRTWVGLTDEERKDIELGIEVFDMSVEDVLKEAEAKLKEKNQ